MHCTLDAAVMHGESGLVAKRVDRGTGGRSPGRRRHHGLGCPTGCGRPMEAYLLEVPVGKVDSGG